MATSNRRDVQLGVEIQAAGEENLTRLATQVRELAKAGGEAGPMFAVLADQIDQAAEQAKALSAYKTAAEGLNETAAAATRAGAAADQLQAKFKEQQGVAEQAVAVAARLREQQDQTTRAIAAQVREQGLLRASQLEGRTSAENYAQANAKITAALANLRNDAAGLKINLRDANAAASDATRELDRLAQASLRASDNAGSLQAALKAQAAAVEDARAAGARLGADFSDVAVAQERLDAALRSAVGALEQRAAAAREVAEADRLLETAARGLADAQERGRLAAQSELAAIRESEAFTQRWERQQRETAAAVQALTDDIDKQAATVRGKLITSLAAASDAYEREQAVLRDTLALQSQRAAKAAEQAEADDLAARAARGLADAREEGRLAAQSELAAIKESEEFSRSYERQQRETAAAVQALTDDLDRQAALVRTNLVKSLAEASASYQKFEVEAEQAASAAQRVNTYFEKLQAQRDIIKSAFGTTGVRSIQDIEREMFNVSQALVTLRAEFAAGRVSLADFERATGSAQTRLRTLKTEIETIPGDTTVFQQLASGANEMITKFGALTAAVATVGLAVKPVIDAFISLESTTRILNQIGGSAAGTAKQIEFLRNVAQQSGQSFADLSQSYAKFAASAQQSGVSITQTQAAFKAVALAAGNLGLSTDQAKRALEALSQIASKGTAGMEELRQQLGDALPGVLPLLAKQLGLTNAELNKLVESGNLSAKEAIPALTAAIQTFANQQGQVSGLSAEFNRFKNVLLEAGTALLDGPLGQAGGALLTAFAGAVRDLSVAAVGASETLRIMGRTVGLIGAAFTGGISGVRQFRDEFDAIVLESADKVTRFRDRAYSGGEAAKALGDAGAAAAPGVQAVANATTQAGQAAQDSAPKHTAAAGAIAQAGQQADAAGKTLQRLKIDYVEASDAAEKATAAARLLVEARKSEAAALQSIAGLTGVEAQARTAASEGARLQAEALDRVAVASQNELTILQNRLATEKAALLSRGALDEQDRKYLQTIEDKIAKQEAALTKDKEAAAAAQALAAAAQLAAETLRDNTSQYVVYKRAVEFATLALESAREEFRRGRVGIEAVTAASLELAKAQGRLKDSINDTVVAVDNKIRRMQAEAELARARLQITLEEQKAALRQAELLGNETAAAQARIKIKEIELQLAREAARAKADENAEVIRATEQQLRELELAGQLTPEKRTELELRILNAKAKQAEAQAGAVATGQIKAELDALKGLNAEKAKPTPSSTSGSSSAPGSASNVGVRPNTTYGSVLGGIDGAGNSNPAFARDEFGRTAAQRQSMSQQGGPVDNSYIFQLRDRLNRGDTFTAQELPAIENALRVANDNQRLSSNSRVPDLSAQRDDQQWINVLTRVREKALGDVAVGSATGGAYKPITYTPNYGGKASPTVAPAITPATVAAATAANAAAGRRIDINLGGLGSTSVTVASAADEERLIAMFKQLEQAMARSGG